jgi:hypothetical protein
VADRERQLAKRVGRGLGKVGTGKQVGEAAGDEVGDREGSLSASCDCGARTTWSMGSTPSRKAFKIRSRSPSTGPDSSANMRWALSLASMRAA